MDISTQLLVFLGLSFAAGLFFPVFNAIIGTPEYRPHSFVGSVFPNVQELALGRPGMLLRRYGQWLCNKQNAFETKHNKALLHIVKLQLQDTSKVLFSIRTSYNRAEAITCKDYKGSLPNAIEVLNVVKTLDEVTIVMRLLPEEVASVSAYTSPTGSLIGKANSEEVLPNFKRQYMPLSIYKAMGLCGVCTSFWLMLATLIPAMMLGAFTPWLFFLLPAAYALACAGAKSLSFE